MSTVQVNPGPTSRCHFGRVSGSLRPRLTGPVHGTQDPVFVSVFLFPVGSVSVHVELHDFSHTSSLCTDLPLKGVFFSEVPGLESKGWTLYPHY